MKIISIKPVILTFYIVLIFSILSCNPARKYEKQEAAEIQDYLSTNSSLNFELKPSGIYFLEISAGTGSSPVVGDSAFVRYTGMFLNGSVFDTTVGTGKLYGFIVGDNITGFTEGIMLMKPGGKASFLVPSKLGYGGMGWLSIPGYTPLLFDVELVRVKPGPGK